MNQRNHKTGPAVAPSHVDTDVEQSHARASTGTDLGWREQRWRDISLRPGPESLRHQDYQNLHTVRRAIWTEGFQGLLVGSASALLTSIVYPILQSKGLLRMAFKLEPRHRTASVLLGGTLGMVIGASTAGTNNAWRLSEVYGRGAKPQYSTYQSLQLGKSIDEDAQGSERERLESWGYRGQVVAPTQRQPIQTKDAHKHL